MKTREVKFKRKGEIRTLVFPVYEDLKDAVAMVGADKVFEIFMWGQEQIGKLVDAGIDPLKPKKRIVKIDTSKLSPIQLKELKRLGVIQSD